MWVNLKRETGTTTSPARNRYTFFSKVAKKEGYVLVSEMFLKTANQEKTHADWFYRMLQGLKKEESFDEMKVLPDADFPTTLGSTIENLKSAVAGEDMEWQTLYPDIVETAENEGYSDIAKRVQAIIRAEKHHSERYGKLLKLVGDDVFFNSQAARILEHISERSVRNSKKIVEFLI